MIPELWKFSYIRMDKFAALNGNYNEQCMACGKTMEMVDTYHLTPIDLKWFVEEEIHEKVGLIRCYDCIPSNAIEAGEHVRRLKEKRGDA